MIEDGAVEHRLLHQPREVGHIGVANVQCTQGSEEQAWQAVRIAFTFAKLWAVLRNRQHINRKLFLVVVKGQLVALRQQLLHHAFPLLIAGRTFPVGLPVDIEFFGGGPCGSAKDLFGMDSVGKRN